MFSQAKEGSMLVERIIGVFRLDSNVFEDIEHDPNATTQAAIVVALVALLGALGGAIGGIFSEDATVIGSFFGPLVWTFIGWFLWSAATYFVGTSVFRGTATFDEMLRVIGFAYAPQVLSIIPCIGWLIGLIWSAIAGFIAVRQGLDLDDTNSCLTIIIGFFLVLIGYLVVGIFLGPFSLLF
jgi:hypothetical protein